MEALNLFIWEFHTKTHNSERAPNESPSVLASGQGIDILLPHCPVQNTPKGPTNYTGTAESLSCVLHQYNATRITTHKTALTIDGREKAEDKEAGG